MANTQASHSFEIEQKKAHFKSEKLDVGSGTLNEFTEIQTQNNWNSIQIDSLDNALNNQTTKQKNVQQSSQDTTQNSVQQSSFCSLSLTNQSQQEFQKDLDSHCANPKYQQPKDDNQPNLFYKLIQLSAQDQIKNCFNNRQHYPDNNNHHLRDPIYQQPQSITEKPKQGYLENDQHQEQLQSYSTLKIEEHEIEQQRQQSHENELNDSVAFNRNNVLRIESNLPISQHSQHIQSITEKPKQSFSENDQYQKQSLIYSTVKIEEQEIEQQRQQSHENELNYSFTFNHNKPHRIESSLPTFQKLQSKTEKPMQSFSENDQYQEQLQSYITLKIEEQEIEQQRQQYHENKLNDFFTLNHNKPHLIESSLPTSQQPQFTTETPMQGFSENDQHQKQPQIKNTVKIEEQEIEQQRQQSHENELYDSITFNHNNNNFIEPSAQKAAHPSSPSQKNKVTRRRRQKLTQHEEKKKMREESKNMINFFMYRIWTQFKEIWTHNLELPIKYCSLTKFTQKIVALKCDNEILATILIQQIKDYFNNTFLVEILPNSRHIEKKYIYPKYIKAFCNLLDYYTTRYQGGPKSIQRVELKRFLDNVPILTLRTD